MRQTTIPEGNAIRYAPDFAIIVNYKDGKCEAFSHETIPNLTLEGIKSYIKELTTNEKLAEKIKEVIIEHPAAALKGGISIIDTPGTNSIERWHEDVTREAIRDISDASIILTSADPPMPETLIAFVKENLGDVINRCVFVVTKMDLLRAKERERQLTYIKQKIASAFDIEEPTIFPYTPLFVLGEASPDVKQDIKYTKNDYETLVEQSYQTETQIYRILSKQRVIIQVQKLLSVMNTSFTSISTDMQEMSEWYQKSHDALMKVAKCDLREFTAEMKRKYKKAYTASATEARDMVMNEVYGCIETIKREKEQEFNACATKDDLKAYGERFSKSLEEAGNDIIEKVSKRFSLFGKRAKKQLESFWEEFKRYYEELDSLAVMAASKFNVKGNLSTNRASTGQISINNKMSDFDSYENKWAVGSAAGGAWALSWLGPVGWVVGGIGGLIFGLVQAEKKFNEYKSKAWPGVRSDMNNYFDRITSAVEKDIAECIKINSQNIDSQIDDCLKSYKQTVDSMIADDEKKKRELETNISALRQDLSEIENRKYKINAVAKRLGGNKAEPNQANQ